MNKSAHSSPGLVDEKTVPIDPGSTGVQREPEKTGSNQADDGLKRKYTSHENAPIPVTEPTELPPTEELHRQKEFPEAAKENQWSRLFWVFILFVASWLLYAATTAVIDVWNTNMWFAIPLTTITVIFVFLLGILIWRELRAFQSIDQIQEIQAQLKQYISEDSILGVHATLKPVLARIKVYYPVEYRQFDEARHDRKTVREYLNLLDNVVLSKLDDDVNKVVSNAVLSVAGLVAISPHPALDAIIVMFRANILLRKIGGIYGIQITGLSSLYLFKHTIISAIMAAGTEELGSIALTEMGAAGIAEKAGKITLESAVSSMRMYRLGNLAKKILRPIPVKAI